MFTRVAVASVVIAGVFATTRVDSQPSPSPAPSRTQVVLLGTGTPPADPDRSGAATAVVVNGTAYLVDFGAGVVRRAKSAVVDKGIAALDPVKLRVAFVTHLHSDHTVGYPDLILTPWVLGRRGPLEVYGPAGIKAHDRTRPGGLQGRLRDADEGPGLYRVGAFPEGHQVNAHEVKPGVVYKDANVTVTAFATKHAMESYGYRFDTGDRSIVISGDTNPTQATIDACRGCDVLVHEVLTADWLSKRPDFHKLRGAVPHDDGPAHRARHAGQAAPAGDLPRLGVDAPQRGLRALDAGDGAGRDVGLCGASRGRTGPRRLLRDADPADLSRFPAARWRGPFRRGRAGGGEHLCAARLPQPPPGDRVAHGTQGGVVAQRLRFRGRSAAGLGVLHEEAGAGGGTGGDLQAERRPDRATHRRLDHLPGGSQPRCVLEPAGARSFVVATTREAPEKGAVFEAPDGTRYALTPVPSLGEAETEAAALGPETRVFAVRPYWGMAAPEWIAADPEFWKPQSDGEPEVASLYEGSSQSQRARRPPSASARRAASRSLARHRGRELAVERPVARDVGRVLPVADGQAGQVGRAQRRRLRRPPGAARARRACRPGTASARC